MKLKQIIVPAVASLLVLAACGGTTSSSEEVSSEASSSLVDSEEAEAAELALRQLPYGTQSNPGMQDRTFDVLTSVSAKAARRLAACASVRRRKVRATQSIPLPNRKPSARVE